jgi:signal transduction histidine kinase
VSRLGIRGRLTLAVALGALVTVALLTIGFNLALRSSLDQDADSVLRARAAATLETVAVRHGTVQAPGATDGGGPEPEAWVYSGRHAVERPPAPPDVHSLADSLAADGGGYAQSDSTDTRLFSEPISADGRQLGMVVASLSLEPYEVTASRALTASLIFAALVFLGMTVAARWAVSHALRPVAEVTRAAAGWSENDIDHRFDVGEPRDELTRLAATFNRILDRLAASLRREQRFSAELSHELRTPLAAILAESELALRQRREGDEYRNALAAIATRARQLDRTLDVLLAAARAESTDQPGSAEVGEVVDRAVEAHRSEADSRGLELLSRQPPERMRIGVDVANAERVLSPLLDNACRYGRRFVELAARRDGAYAHVTVTDDGPGLDPTELECIFEPGVRGLAPARGRVDGAGLGLPLARRLAAAVGGSVEAEANGAGARFVVRLPLA